MPAWWWTPEHPGTEYAPAPAVGVGLWRRGGFPVRDQDWDISRFVFFLPARFTCAPAARTLYIDLAPAQAMRSRVSWTWSCRQRDTDSQMPRMMLDGQMQIVRPLSPLSRSHAPRAPPPRRPHAASTLSALSDPVSGGGGGARAHHIMCTNRSRTGCIPCPQVIRSRRRRRRPTPPRGLWLRDHRRGRLQARRPARPT